MRTDAEIIHALAQADASVKSYFIERYSKLLLFDAFQIIGDVDQALAFVQIYLEDFSLRMQAEPLQLSGKPLSQYLIAAIQREALARQAKK